MFCFWKTSSLPLSTEKVQELESIAKWALLGSYKQLLRVFLILNNREYSLNNIEMGQPLIRIPQLIIKFQQFLLSFSPKALVLTSHRVCLTMSCLFCTVSWKYLVICKFLWAQPAYRQLKTRGYYGKYLHGSKLISQGFAVLLQKKCRCTDNALLTDVSLGVNQEPYL